ncbi:MAG: hypothetical protein ABJB16_14535 [Saprospiraceae bacterium]
MKLNPQILKLARHEAHHHLMSDLNFTMELHRFMKNVIDQDTYLSSEFGFKKFLNDYGVGRTLKAGDEPKLKILSLIKEFQFGKSHVDEISNLAYAIQQNGHSSHSGKSGPGLPQSFCSKFLFVLKPDKLIPYDSYVLKSLQLRIGHPLRSLEQYYEHADQFRRTHFPEKGPEVNKIRDKSDPDFRKQLIRLKVNCDKVLSWKLTDKYLWCEHEERRKR